MFKTQIKQNHDSSDPASEQWSDSLDLCWFFSTKYLSVQIIPRKIYLENALKDTVWSAYSTKTKFSESS